MTRVRPARASARPAAAVTDRSLQSRRRFGPVWRKTFQILQTERTGERQTCNLLRRAKKILRSIAASVVRRSTLALALHATAVSFRISFLGESRLTVALEERRHLHLMEWSNICKLFLLGELVLVVGGFALRCFSAVAVGRKRNAGCSRYYYLSHIYFKCSSVQVLTERFNT